MLVQILRPFPPFQVANAQSRRPVMPESLLGVDIAGPEKSIRASQNCDTFISK